MEIHALNEKNRPLAQLRVSISCAYLFSGIMILKRELLVYCSSYFYVEAEMFSLTHLQELSLKKGLKKNRKE